MEGGACMPDLKCSKCYHERKYANAKYCYNCGMTFGENNCTNETCQNNSVNLSSKDCYCYICGHKTNFFQSGYIKPGEEYPF